MGTSFHDVCVASFRLTAELLFFILVYLVNFMLLKAISDRDYYLANL